MDGSSSIWIPLVDGPKLLRCPSSAHIYTYKSSRRQSEEVTSLGSNSGLAMKDRETRCSQTRTTFLVASPHSSRRASPSLSLLKTCAVLVTIPIPRGQRLKLLIFRIGIGISSSLLPRVFPSFVVHHESFVYSNFYLLERDRY